VGPEADQSASEHLGWPIFSRSYCYTVWSAIGIIMSPVCPPVYL